MRTEIWSALFTVKLRVLVTVIEFSLNPNSRNSVSLSVYIPQRPSPPPPSHTHNQQPLKQLRTRVQTPDLSHMVPNSGRLKIASWLKLCFSSWAPRWNDPLATFPGGQTEGHRTGIRAVLKTWRNDSSLLPHFWPISSQHDPELQSTVSCDISLLNL